MESTPSQSVVDDCGSRDTQGGQSGSQPTPTSQPSSPIANQDQLDITTQQFVDDYENSRDIQKYLDGKLIDPAVIIAKGYHLRDYRLACYVEDYMRANMYQQSHQQHHINTDPYWGLIKITEKRFAELTGAINSRGKQEPSTDLLFNDYVVGPAKWPTIVKNLREYAKYLEPGVFMAGGALFGTLFSSKINDFDLFIHDDIGDKTPSTHSSSGHSPSARSPTTTDPKEPSDVVTPDSTTTTQSEVEVEPDERLSARELRAIQLMVNFKAKLKNHTVITRSANALTFSHQQYKGISGYVAPQFDKYQFVLRLYRTPSEILHGFDVDSCCIGFDGTNLWMTSRCYYALLHGYNTVNFERLSPSYEQRLIKYARRGIAIYVPNFSRSAVNTDAIEKAYAGYQRLIRKGGSNVYYGYFFQFKGLQRLLLLEHHYSRFNDYKADQEADMMAASTSDYNPIPHSEYKVRQYGQPLLNQITNYTGSHKSLRYYSMTMLRLLDKYVPDYQFPELDVQNDRQMISELSEDRKIDGMAKAADQLKTIYLPKLGEYLDAVCIGGVFIRPICESASSSSSANPSSSTQDKKVEITDNTEPKAVGGIESKEEEVELEKVKIPTDLKITKEMNTIKAFYGCLMLEPCYVNNLKRIKRVDLIDGCTELAFVLAIPKLLYNAIDQFRKWSFPRVITFKTTNPGEQMTNTFTRIVLADNAQWYTGPFYHLPGSKQSSDTTPHEVRVEMTTESDSGSDLEEDESNAESDEEGDSESVTSTKSDEFDISPWV